MSERAREGDGRRAVIAGWQRCVGVTRRECEYASRQCKIIYGLYWRNRHRSAPARSGYGHHVKCGSCDMPLRSAKSRPGQHRVGGLGWSRMVRLCRGELRRGASAVAAVGGGAREALLAACVRACVRAWKRVDPRERANGTREWNGLEQAIAYVMVECLTRRAAGRGSSSCNQAAREDEQQLALM